MHFSRPLSVFGHIGLFLFRTNQSGFLQGLFIEQLEISIHIQPALPIRLVFRGKCSSMSEELMRQIISGGDCRYTGNGLMFWHFSKKDLRMKFPKLEDLNSERFLEEAFDPATNEKWIGAVRLRRNVYLWFFLTGIACIFITAFPLQMHMSVLSLFLATLSLVVMTKYDTQLHFLTKLKLRGPEQEEEPEPQ